jgi:hypothetical protein
MKPPFVSSATVGARSMTASMASKRSKHWQQIDSWKIGCHFESTTIKIIKSLDGPRRFCQCHHSPVQLGSVVGLQSHRLHIIPDRQRQLVELGPFGELLIYLRLKILAETSPGFHSSDYMITYRSILSDTQWEFRILNWRYLPYVSPM